MTLQIHNTLSLNKMVLAVFQVKKKKRGLSTSTYNSINLGRGKELIIWRRMYAIWYFQDILDD